MCYLQVQEVDNMSSANDSNLADPGQIWVVSIDDGLYNMEMLKSSQKEMKLLWEDGDLFDITLEVGGQSIQAHKVFLATHSPYFKAMFCGSFIDAKKNSIELKGRTSTSLRCTFRM